MRKLLLAVLLLTGACATTDSDTSLVACPPEGCAALDPPDAREQALRQHAAFDLQCGQRLRVSYDDADGQNALVSGCGRQARYAEVGHHTTRWVLDSPIFVAPEPAR